MNNIFNELSHHNKVLVEKTLPYSLYLQRMLTANFFDLIQLMDALDHPLDTDFFISYAPWDEYRKNQDEESLSRDLRILRHFVVCHIMIRDINLLSDLHEVTNTISLFADFCIKLATQFSHEYYEEMYGTVQNMQGENEYLSVIAMGKMGGYELNVSSDIDLVFIYPENAMSNGKKQISSQEYFTKVGKKIISLLNDTTPWNQVFRVDMRLRPDGDSGSLVLSESALEQYLIKHGRDWERYAWIKARVVTQYQNDLKSLVRPFVFRKYLDYTAYDGMRRLHAQIRQEVERKNIKDNIKLGEGGIREIEFIAQIYQLIRGGQTRSLQLKGTQETYIKLAELNLIQKEEKDQLLDAYRFLRNVEHRLQYYDDKQTQTLPHIQNEQNLLAQSMRFDSYDKFIEALDFHRNHVRYYFNRMLADPDSDKSEGIPKNQNKIETKELDAKFIDENIIKNTPINNWENILNEIKDVIRHVSHDDSLIDETSEHLKILGFDNIKSVLCKIHSLKNNSKYKHISLNAQNRLEKILPQIILLCSQQEHKDQTFNRILEFLDAVLRRSSYLALLHERPHTLKKLVYLIGQSQFVACYLTRHPILLDDLLSDSLMNINWNWPKEESILNERTQLYKEDIELQMDAVRHFQHSRIFKIAVQDLDNLWSVEHLSDQLTELADIILRNAMTEVWSVYNKKHCEKPYFAIIGYGKLGGKELSYTSDLDLVYIYNDETPMCSEIYSRFANRLTTWLSGATAAGILYDVDTRLRPNGESGLTVISLSSFKKYQLEKAWTWEHQALTRARFIAGDESIGKQFEDFRKEILMQVRDLSKLKNDIISMREKVKQSHDHSHKNVKYAEGGIFDVEFIVQYLVLAYSHQYPQLIGNLGNIALLNIAQEKNLTPREMTVRVENAYRTYRKLQHNMKIKDIDVIVDENLMYMYHDVIELWNYVFNTNNV